MKEYICGHKVDGPADLEAGYKKEVCPFCAVQQKAGTKVFEGFMASLFMQVMNLAKEDRTGKVRVSAKEVRENLGAIKYTRFGDLKHWGLLAQEPGAWHYGLYTVTDKAFEFMNGSRSIPRSVRVMKGSVLDTSPELISISEAFGAKWNDVEQWIKDWRSGHKNILNSRQGKLL